MAVLSFSLQSVYDQAGNRIMDGRLKIYNAGTTTPARTYADPGFANLLPFPIPARGNGTLPLVYLPPGTYDLRVTDPYGGVFDQISGYTIEAPSSGGGGGGTVDPTTVFQTGDEKTRYGRGALSGWVRENGRTIGPASSSASERANDDTHALFVFLWNQDPNLAVAGGRGSNAESDWAAGKTIALPDMRGRFSGGLDDMGNTAAGRLTGGTFAFGDAVTLGAYGGGVSTTLTQAMLPNYSLPVSATMDAQGGHAHNGTTSGVGNHNHVITYQRISAYAGGGAAGAVNVLGDENAPNSGTTTQGSGGHSHTFTTDVQGVHAHNITVSVSLNGGGQAFSTLPPFLLKTFYLKL